MRAFVIGNGPSLAHTPLDLLANKDTFAMNRIHLIYPRTQWRPKFFAYVDYSPGDADWRAPIDANLGVVEHMWLLDFFKEGLPPGHPNHGMFPPEMAVGDLPNTTWVRRCKHHFYTAPNPRGAQAWHLPEICTAYTFLSGLVQIAVMMGYDEIVFVGCDLGYAPDKSNHFSEDYMTIQLQPSDWAQTEANVRKAHEIIKEECEKRGVLVINASVGGSLDLYPRVPLESLV